MSLYRQAGRASGRTIAGVAAAALLAGIGLGYTIGAAGDDQTSVAEAVAALRDDLTPIRNGLDFVPTEYREGVRDGRVVSQPEYGAARAAVGRAQEVFLRVEPDVRALSPTRAAALRATLTSLGAAINARKDDAEVESLANRAQTQLDGLFPG